MKQIVAVGKIAENDRAAFDYLGRFFGVQTFEHGIDTARGLMSALKPNLIMIHITELLTLPMMTLDEIIKENAPTPVITYGPMEEFVQFGAVYAGAKVEHLGIPVDEQSALNLVCAKLKESPERLLAATAGRKKLLVVDDDATTLRSLKTMLENKYEVTLANSGKKAFEMMRKAMPDLILLDYEMPEMNGKEFLKVVRATSQWKSVPVIFVTSVSDMSYIRELVALKPSGYLLKPVTPDVLIKEIAKVLG